MLWSTSGFSQNTTSDTINLETTKQIMQAVERDLTEFQLTKPIMADMGARLMVQDGIIQMNNETISNLLLQEAQYKSREIVYKAHIKELDTSLGVANRKNRNGKAITVGGIIVGFLIGIAIGN